MKSPLQAMKNGALIGAACEAGAILGRTDAKRREALGRYARARRLAFQIATISSITKAKARPPASASARTRRAAGEFVSALGAEGARKLLQELVREAEAALMPFGVRGLCSRPARGSSPNAALER